MRIAIVNDLALAREVLRRLVLSVPGHTVAWTAEDGENIDGNHRQGHGAQHGWRPRE